MVTFVNTTGFSKNLKDKFDIRGLLPLLLKYIVLTSNYFRPSKSPYWNRLTEYISAEVAGREGGDCTKFERDCGKSLYKLNKYS